ncbi:MAG: PaaI family thioesterase [Myxococcales bacterium]|jgi:uncharacterized protein (TIGR00369 family)|nr:PaaI family thioesterase [Myxococcales bacterium]
MALDLHASFNPAVAAALPEYSRRSPFAGLLGIEVVAVEPGAVRCQIESAEKLTSGVGAVHGGALVALVDHAMSLAVYPVVEIGKWVATLELKVSYVAPVRQGVEGPIVAEATVVSLKKRIATVRVDVTFHGELVATAMGTTYVRERLGAAS